MSHETTAQAEAPTPRPPTTEQLWQLFAQAERLASDARQLEREADELQSKAQDLGRAATLLEQAAEAIARDADPTPPPGLVM